MQMSFRSELYQSLGTLTDVPRPASARSLLQSPLGRLTLSQALQSLQSQMQQKQTRRNSNEDQEGQDGKENQEVNRQGFSQQRQGQGQGKQMLQVFEEESQSIGHLNHIRVRSSNSKALFYSQRLRSTQSSVKQSLARAGLQFEQKQLQIQIVEQQANSKLQVAVLSTQQLFSRIEFRRSELKSQLANSVHITPRIRKNQLLNPEAQVQSRNQIPARFIRLQHARPINRPQKGGRARPLNLSSPPYEHKRSDNQFLVKIRTDCIRELKTRPQIRLPECPPLSNSKRFSFSKPCPKQPRLVRLDLSHTSTKHQILEQKRQLGGLLRLDIQRIVVRKFKNAIGFLLPQSKIYILYHSQRIYYGDWNNCKEGHAVEALPDSERSYSWMYEGQFKNGTRDGQGTLWTAQEVYSGQWRSRLREGRGTIWRGREMLEVRYKHNSELH